MSAYDSLISAVLEHPLHRAMGVETIEASAGRSRIELAIGANAVNMAGVLHGGVVYTVCDMACYAALLTLLPEGDYAVTHDIHVSLLRAARLGDRIVFSGRVIKRGRGIAFMEAEAHCGDQLLARATVTKSILKTAAA